MNATRMHGNELPGAQARRAQGAMRLRPPPLEEYRMRQGCIRTSLWERGSMASAGCQALKITTPWGAQNATGVHQNELAGSREHGECRAPGAWDDHPLGSTECDRGASGRACGSAGARRVQGARRLRSPPLGEHRMQKGCIRTSLREHGECRTPGA